MKKILIVGGANGIGLSIAKVLAARESVERVYVVDKAPLADEHKDAKIESRQFDLTSADYSALDRYDDIDGLFITVGFGRLALFSDIPEAMIQAYFNVNTVAVIHVIRHFYDRLLSADRDFYCGAMVSIAGFMSSPFFSLYGASKAALKIFIESVNVELEKAGSTNRILNVSPGHIQGTNFNGGGNDLSLTRSLAEDIISHLERKDDLFIPQYEEIYKNVLERYHADFRAEGSNSYDYKIKSGRVGSGAK